MTSFEPYDRVLNLLDDMTGTGIPHALALHAENPLHPETPRGGGMDAIYRVFGWGRTAKNISYDPDQVKGWANLDESTEYLCIGMGADLYVIPRSIDHTPLHRKPSRRVLQDAVVEIADELAYESEYRADADEWADAQPEQSGSER